MLSIRILLVGNSAPLYLDIHSIFAILFPTTYDQKSIDKIDTSTTNIQIPDRTCNDLNYKVFDFLRFTFLKYLDIGDYCFCSVNIFVLDGLSSLTTLRIGNKSFTSLWNGISDCTKADNKSRAFHIVNCNQLKSIEIGENSFCDYAGGFELRNLPKLFSIRMKAYNFCFSSFVIDGNDCK